jgi:hypothetical protein
MLQKIHFEGLKPNTQYYFQVVATSADGALKSAPSNVISFTTISDTTAPNPISSLTTDFSTTTFTATWAGPDINDTPDFLDYKVVLTNPSNTASKTIYTKNKFTALTLDENRNIFGAGTPSASIQISASSRDTSGNLSTGVSTTAVNPVPTTTPVISASGAARGFYATWPTIPDTFNDYAYTAVYVDGNEVWRGTANYMQYTNPIYALETTLSITAKHFDVFNQPSSISNTKTVKTESPVTVNVTPPDTPTGLILSAGNSGGAAGLGGYITASWTEVTNDSTLRGVKLRLNAQGDTTYQYENVSSSVLNYQINNLIPGFTYEIAVASFDEINNTSSFSPLSTVTIPYNTTPFTASATATVGASIVTITSTFSASNIGAIVAGTGIKPGTRVLAINSNSASLSTITTASLSNTVINFYPGISNWQSYITAGVDDGTGAVGSSSYMKLGTGVSGTKHGLWLNNNNYWYTTGTFKVGSDTSYFSWDGTTASISGDIRANSGSFLGNVNVASNGSLYAGNSPTSGARTIFNASGVVGYNSSGFNTFLLDSTTGYLTASGATISGTINGLTIGFGGPNSSSTNTALGATTLVNMSAPPGPPNSNALSIENIAIGSSALFKATTAGQNIAIGYLSQRDSNSGNSNVAIGPSTLISNASGNANIAIGNAALMFNFGSFNIGIGDNTLSLSSSGAYNIAIGSESTTNNTTGVYNVGMGASSLYKNTTGAYNTSIGYQSLINNTTGSYNIAMGYQALYSNTIATYNIAIGASAQYKTQGDYNISLGYKSLVGSSVTVNNTGTNNVGIGYLSLTSNTSGIYNVGLGGNTLASNTSGDRNIGIGSYAFVSNKNGNYNIGIGHEAGFNSASGSNNTYLGYQAGQRLTGNNNTVIGSTVGTSVSSLYAFNGIVAIGVDNANNGALVTGDNQFVLGTSNHNLVAEGKLVIGSTDYTTTTFTNTGTRIFLNNDGRGWFTGAAGLAPLIVHRTGSTGNLVLFYNQGNATQAGAISCSSVNSLQFVSGSDYRLKKNIEPIINASDKIKKLNPVNFTWKNDNHNDYGFIAHEIQDVIPQMVVGEKDAINEDGSIDAQMVDYAKLTPILAAALKEALIKIDELSASVTALAAR